MNDDAYLEPSQAWETDVLSKVNASAMVDDAELEHTVEGLSSRLIVVSDGERRTFTVDHENAPRHVARSVRHYLR